MLRLARAADRFLQRVVRPDSDRVAWISDPDHVGNAFHLYRHALTTRPGLHHVWLVVDDVAGRHIVADVEGHGSHIAAGATVRVVHRHRLAGYLAFLRCGLVFHTHGVYPMTTTAHRREIVSLWHGMPIKAIGRLNARTPNPHPTFGTMHLATSEWFRPVIARAFDVDPDAVVVSGLPRCDVLTRPHPLAPSPERLRALVGVERDAPFVLWTPTYRVSSDRVGGEPARTFLDDLGRDELAGLDRAAGVHGVVVVVKLHPYDPLNQRDTCWTAGLDHVRVLRSPELLASGVELYDLLAVADGLLTDVSSVLIDWLVGDRPLGVVGFDPDAYERDMVIAFDEIAASDRIHDIADPADRDDFFAAVATGRSCAVGPGDVAARWYDAPPGRACEAVLSALGR